MMKHSLSVLTLYAALLLTSLSACSWLSAPAGKEPGAIVIRNSSGAGLVSASLFEAGRTSGQTVRFGSVAPVPAGVAQSLVRSTKPPPLPREMTLEWVDAKGGTHRRELPLAGVLQQATGGHGEALVFEIGYGEEVRVVLEYLAP